MFCVMGHLVRNKLIDWFIDWLSSFCQLKTVQLLYMTSNASRTPYVCSKNENTAVLVWKHSIFFMIIRWNKTSLSFFQSVLYLLTLYVIFSQYETFFNLINELKQKKNKKLTSRKLQNETPKSSGKVREVNHCRWMGHGDYDNGRVKLKLWPTSFHVSDYCKNLCNNGSFR